MHRIMVRKQYSLFKKKKRRKRNRKKNNPAGTLLLSKQDAGWRFVDDNK